MKKILIIVKSELLGGCQAYRLIYPYSALLSAYSKDFEINYCSDINNVNDFDLALYHFVVFHKDFVSTPQIERCQKMGCKTIVDFDDFWMLHSRHIMWNFYKETNRTKELIEIQKKTDFVHVSTNKLAIKARDNNKNVFVFPNAIDPSLPQFFRSNHLKYDKMKFGYLGGVSHLDDVAIISGIIPSLTINEKTADKFEMHLFGYDPKNPVYKRYAYILTNFGELNKNFKAHVGLDVFDYTRYYNTIDVALAPLTKDMFNSMKSELKIVEAGYYKKAIIVSDVSPYREHIKHKKNGLLASGTSDFNKCAKYCIENPLFVKESGEALYNYVSQTFNLAKINQARADFFLNVKL